MNLTVAMKIIGGFAIITLLLLITSIVSLSNLGKINNATMRVSKLAIPTLKGSSELDVTASQMGTILLRAYYQTSSKQLTKIRNEFDQVNNEFSSSYKKLQLVIKDEPDLRAALKKLDVTYDAFQTHVNNLFDNRAKSITTLSSVKEQTSQVEDSSDDASTALLDLGDNKLAKTKLKKAITLGGALESKFNSLVSSALEYRDSTGDESVKIVQMELNNGLDELAVALKEISVELNNNGAPDVAKKLNAKFDTIKTVLTSPNGIFKTKHAQLDAIAQATKELAASTQNIKEANDIVGALVKLADVNTQQITHTVKSSVAGGKSTTWIILVISIVAAIGITYVTLMSITRPLTKINDMLNVVASGDLSRKLDETGKDEFATLARNCNQVIENLRILIQSIINRSTQLAAAAEQTSAVTAQSTTAIEEQRSQLEQAASATTQMSSTSQSMMESVNDALTEIKQADEEAEHVKHIYTQNKRTIEQLANEVESASQVINKLQQDSASIGSILDVIRGIAEQTNLLALNAAIEAARAGEQGRGFAVVADEVRTLASRTQSSTQEIQNMIQVLQSGSQKAVSVMDAGKIQANECVKQADVAAQALETITEAVHHAYDRSTQVATAANEQSVVAHEISENLESIVAIAEQTTAGSHQTAASSSEVAKLAEELQQSVQEFKV